MTGQRLGRLSLRLDAIYCMTLGVGVAVTAPSWQASVGLPLAVLIAAGVVVFVWALAVEWMRAKLPLGTALRAVMCVNIVATIAVAGVSMTGAVFLAVLLILSVAVDVALFAGSQAVALRRLRPRA